MRAHPQSFRFVLFLLVFLTATSGLLASPPSDAPSVAPHEDAREESLTRDALVHLYQGTQRLDLPLPSWPSGSGALDALHGQLQLLDARLRALRPVRLATPGVETPDQGKHEALRRAVAHALGIVETLMPRGDMPASITDPAARHRELERVLALLGRLGDPSPPPDATDAPAVSSLAAPGVASQGTIEGTVTDAATTNPLEGERVEAYEPTGSFVDATESAADGGYQLDLEPGQYFLRVRRTGAYVGELYDDLTCPFSCDLTAGDAVTVLGGQTTSNIDFALDLGGSFSGTVTESATGTPVGSGAVNASDSTGSSIGSVFLAADGTFVVEGLPTGTYHAVGVGFTTVHNLIPELYDDIRCPLLDCEPTTGTGIAVTLGANTPDIDFALDEGGIFSGTVTNAVGGAPIASELVKVFPVGNPSVSSFVFTEADGSYAVMGLATGNYLARTAVDANFVDEIFDDIPCPFDDCDVATGTSIAVTEGAETTGVDFALQPGGTITGTVTNAANGAPLEGELMRLFDGSQIVFSKFTAADGSYEFKRLPADDYFVQAAGTGDFVSEIYDDTLCPVSCLGVLGDAIPVTAGGVVSGIDFALDLGGTIAGTITSETDGQIIPGATLLVLDPGLTAIKLGATLTDGAYSVTGLAAGSYFMTAGDYPDHAAETFDNLPCSFSSCDPTAADSITVTAGVVTANIDFELPPMGACGDDIADQVTLSDHTWTVPVTYEACQTLTMGTNTTIDTGGDVTLKAGETVILGDGFSVGAGGGLTVVIDPSLAP